MKIFVVNLFSRCHLKTPCFGLCTLAGLVLFGYTRIIMKKVIGIVGFIGSGKGTVGDYLSSAYSFKQESFANSLKDVVASVFCWPRNMIEGNTPESREWREIPDPYWSAKLNRVITPRWAMQNLGTELFRQQFFDDIWIWSLEKRLADSDVPVVITDARFPNEISMIRQMGGDILWVRREGKLPEWYKYAANNPGDMPTQWPAVHVSEYMWIKCGPFIEITNNGTLENLYKQVDELI